MTVRTLLTCCVFPLLLVTAAPVSVLSADKLATYHNKEFDFGFQYPASWTIDGTAAANIRVKVVAQSDSAPAECAVVVKRYPKAVNAKQSEIDPIFATPPTTAELEEVLSQEGRKVSVMKANSVMLSIHPAHQARVQYKIDRDAYASGRVLMTATPGLTWTLSCSGLGDTPANADKSYQHWDKAIDNLIASFTFK